MSVSLDAARVELEEALACVKWISRRVAGEDATPEPFEAGLFRVSPSEATMTALKAFLRSSPEEGLPYQRICAFVAEHRMEKGITEATNAICSLLKWNLRNLPQPVLDFAFCTEDLAEFALVGEMDDAKRSEIGTHLAQDIIHVVVTNHASASNATIKVVISLVGQLMSLLSMVTRRKELRMQSYDLFVVFLPSICGSRNPTQLMKEHQNLKRLNDLRKRAELESTRPPQTRLEVMVAFGGRIWGYVSFLLPELDQVIEALRQFDRENSRIETGFRTGNADADNLTRRRKRDIIKRIFKPQTWFQETRRIDASSIESQQRHPPPAPISPSTTATSAGAKASTSPAYAAKRISLFNKNPVLSSKQPQRVGSLRLEAERVKSSQKHSSLPVSAPKSPVPSRRQTSAPAATPEHSEIKEMADMGRLLFQRATSAESPEG